VSAIFQESLADWPSVLTWSWLWLRVEESRICCGGVFEYLHSSPLSRRRPRKWKSGIWGSKIYSRVPRDSYTRMTALARASSKCKRQTRPLVRDSVPQQQTCNSLKVIKIWSSVSNGRLTSRQTGRLPVGRNITLILTLALTLTLTLTLRGESLFNQPIWNLQSAACNLQIFNWYSSVYLV
jgi:hypothetical protein